MLIFNNQNCKVLAYPTMGIIDVIDYSPAWKPMQSFKIPIPVIEALAKLDRATATFEEVVEVIKQHG